MASSCDGDTWRKVLLVWAATTNLRKSDLPRRLSLPSRRRRAIIQLSYRCSGENVIELACVFFRE
jgi:hypothetical protein